MRVVIEVAYIETPGRCARAGAATAATVLTQSVQLRHRQATIEKLTHEMAVLKRLKFAAKSESFSAEQKSLLEETIDADLEALGRELEREQPDPPVPSRRNNPGASRCRPPAAARDPPRARGHRLWLRLCAQAHRRGRGREARLHAGPVHGGAAHPWQMGVHAVRDADPGAGAGARHRQGPAHHGAAGAGAGGQVRRPPAAVPAGAIFARAGLALSRSTLAQWVGACGVQLQPLVDALKIEMLARPVLHADETPVAMLKPGHGKTHRAYLWSYGTTVFDPLKAVVFDFAESRAGRHVQRSSARNDAGWRGTLMCDDYAGYKALFGDRHHRGRLPGACAAQVLRPVGESQEHGGRAGAGVLRRAVRHRARGQGSRRRRTTTDRQLKAQPIADDLHAWLLLHRQRVPEGSATARAIDYSLNRWAALTRYLGDGGCRSTTTGSRTGSARSRSDGRIGCLPAACAPAARRRDHEPGRLGQHERARSVRLPARRARAAADAPGQPHRRTAAAPLAVQTAALIHRSGQEGFAGRIPQIDPLRKFAAAENGRRFHAES